MNTFKDTPWKVRTKTDERGSFYGVEDSKGHPVLPTLCVDKELMVAISALPDLLEALERFIAFADKQNLEYESALVRQCKAAIAKATGKPI